MTVIEKDPQKKFPVKRNLMANKMSKLNSVKLPRSLITQYLEDEKGRPKLRDKQRKFVVFFLRK